MSPRAPQSPPARASSPLSHDAGRAHRRARSLPGRSEEPAQVATPARERLDRRAMAVLSAAHLFTDVNQGAVPALLPFMIAQRGLSYAAASGLVLAATISSSVIQPLFGHLSDRHARPWLMPGGLLLAGIGLCLAGAAPSYPLTFLAIVASGIGVAAFHPEGSRYANYASGSRRTSGMSLFSVGGNVGYASGPVLVTPLVLLLGLSGTLLMVLPAAAMAALLAAEVGRLRTLAPGAAAQEAARVSAPEAWGPFSRLTGVIAFRSFIYFGLVTFVPLYFVGILHASKAQGNAALTVMLLGGAIGTLAGGRLADRFGRRVVLVGSMAALAPLIAAFLVAGQALATILIGFAGAATVATFSVTVVMAHQYLPGRIGVASGVALGLSIGLGGVAAPLLGLVADRYGLRSTLEVIAALPLVAVGLAFTLPGGDGARARMWRRPAEVA